MSPSKPDQPAEEAADARKEQPDSKIEDGPEGKPAEHDEKPGAVSRGVDAAIYGLSLPERALRGMIGCTTGVAKETAELAVPDAMKGSRLYEMTVNKMMGFLVHDIGKIQDPSKTDGDSEASDEESQFLAKKAIGNAVDFAGLAAFHISPIWVLAIFSDVTLGSKTYLNALSAELKKQGVLEKSATIDSIDKILDNLQKTTGMIADNLDTPPITVDQMKKSLGALREESKRVDLAKAFPEEDLAAIWNEIKNTASTENRSVLEVSNAVAMMTYNQMARAGKGAYASVKVGVDLVNVNVLSYYKQAFSDIHEKGYYETVLDAYEPYMLGLKNLFGMETETTTEQVLKGKPFRGIWAWLKGCCGGKKKTS